MTQGKCVRIAVSSCPFLESAEELTTCFNEICLAAEVQAAFYLQVGRLGLIADGQDMVQDESQRTFTEGESACIQPPGLRLGRAGHSGIGIHGIDPLIHNRRDARSD
jgi:hypothetical protein